MEFESFYILFLIPVILGFLLFWYRQRRNASFLFPSKFLLSTKNRSWKLRTLWLPNILRAIAIILFIVALARPRLVLEEQIVKAEGIDIILAIDISGSMLAEDFEVKGKRVNRLAVVKEVVKDFIAGREADQIGLVGFAGLAYMVCPLTVDYDWLTKNLGRLEIGVIEDGTAVGSAIASSLIRLKKSEAKSKVIILLTDGVNNVMDIDPLDAAEIAKSYGVKIYTIGAGSKGYAPYPTRDIFGRHTYRNVRIEIDEETLTQIAQKTGGRYFRATDTASLQKIYEAIDELEKTEIEQEGYFEYEEIFGRFLLAGLVFLLIEIILRNTVYLRLP